MTAFEVSVHVFPEFEGLVSSPWLRGVAERALSLESQEAGSRLSVVLAAAGAVRELNRQHRGLDESTDVLSFSFTHHGEYYGEAPRDAEPAGGLEFVLPPGQSEPLGEVVISYPTARVQADGAGHSIEKELELLLTHGVLHLLGHDHEEPGEEAAMSRAQQRVLAQALPEG
jgi:probable rRNA maturation factor